jgi:hypothetical protein
LKTLLIRSSIPGSGYVKSEGEQLVPEWIIGSEAFSAGKTLKQRVGRQLTQAAALGTHSSRLANTPGKIYICIISGKICWMST